MTGQEQTGELLSQLEETLGGLRVVKAFNAENKLVKRFRQLTKRIRNTFVRIHGRYLLAHPMSEFLGTIVIAILLWYGGSLILNNKSLISAPEFIYYLVIFYSIIAPFKELSKAAYSVNKGMASLQRVDDILKSENPLKQQKNPISISTFTSEIEFKDVWFKYVCNNGYSKYRSYNSKKKNSSIGRTVWFRKIDLVDLILRLNIATRQLFGQMGLIFYVDL